MKSVSTVSVLVAVAVVACCCAVAMVKVEAGLPVNVWPNWDLCPNGGDLFSCSGRGACNGDKCQCTGGYTRNDCAVPPGGWSYPRPVAAATYFCSLETGGCSAGMCIGGGGSFTGANLPDGITGVCALNPTMYGSRFAYMKGKLASPRTPWGQYTFVGQSCGTCWELKRASTTVRVVTIDRCAGWCKSDGPTCTPNGVGHEEECGQCIAADQPSVGVCSCYSPAAKNNDGYCDGNKAVGCDWCSNNDHAHFDLDQTTYNTLCGPLSNQGHCDLDSFQMIDCGHIKAPFPNGYYGPGDEDIYNSTIKAQPILVANN